MVLTASAAYFKAAIGCQEVQKDTMNAKRKGATNEHRSMAIWEASDYVCTRAAASLGVFDVIGIGAVDLILLQVKSNRPPDPAEMEQLKMFRRPPNARKLVHVWKDRAHSPIVKEV